MKGSEFAEDIETVKTWFGDFTVSFSKSNSNSNGNFQIISYDLCPKNISDLCERFINLKPSTLDFQFLNQNAGTFPVNLRDIAISSGFVSDEKEYLSLLNAVSVNSVNFKISKSLTEDKNIIQAIEALDDVNESLNLLSERLKEWFGVYAPDSDLLGEEFAEFAVLKTSSVAKGNTESESTESKFLSILDADFPISSAAPLSYTEANLIGSFASDICNLYKRRSDLESYIYSKMKSVAPTLSSVAGESLGARLISMAGSLKRLSNLPSSTVQVMGADKSLFKHKRSRAPSPKHGIIFNHNAVGNSPPQIRGKMAKILSSHISLAARIDYYSGVFNPEISESMNSKFQNVIDNYRKEKSDKKIR